MSWLKPMSTVPAEAAFATVGVDPALDSRRVSTAPITMNATAEKIRPVRRSLMHALEQAVSRAACRLATADHTDGL